MTGRALVGAARSQDLRRLWVPPARSVARGVVYLRTHGWADHSRLFAVGERTGWSVDEDARQLEAAARRSGYEVAPARLARFVDRQSVFLTSHFEALQPRWLESTHRLGTAYLHGRPGTPGYPEFDTRVRRRCAATPIAFTRSRSRTPRCTTSCSRLVSIPPVFSASRSGSTSSTSLSATPRARTHARATLEIPTPRSSSARSRRTVLAGRRAGAEARQGAGRSRRRSGAGQGGRARALRPSDRPRARLRPSRARAARDPVRPCSGEGPSPSSPVPTTRSTSTSFRRGRRAGRRQCWKRWPTGTPLVTTSVGQVTEIASPGVDALVVDVEDAEGLAAKALRLRDDASLRSGLTLAGRVRSQSATTTAFSTEPGTSFSAGSSIDASEAMDASRARFVRYVRAAGRWAQLLTGGQPGPGVRVFYGHDRVPAPGEPVAGGTAKFQRLATRFPNQPTDFSLLYLGSTWLPRDLRALLWHVRRRRIPLLLNQNGVGYPGWAGSGTEAFNRPLRTVLGAAEHVLYQSEFCKRAADELVAEPAGTWEVLHNAVDIRHFTPAEQPPEDGPVLLLGGDQYQAYRLQLGLETLAALLPSHPDAQLLVTGRLVTQHGADRRASRAPAARAFPRALFAGGGAGALPASARPAPHEGQRPVPEPRDRGDGSRPARRLSAERRRAGARRRRRRHRRAPSGRLRAGRAAECRRARRRAHCGCSPIYPRTRQPLARVRSNGSHSSPGSTVTPSCSGASRRDSRARGLGTLRAGTRPVSHRGERATRACRRAGARAFVRPPARDSRACAAGSRRSHRRARRCAGRPGARDVGRRVTGRIRSALGNAPPGSGSRSLRPTTRARWIRGPGARRTRRRAPRPHAGERS